MENIINVYSEIGQLKKVLVHTPGRELALVTPSRLKELLLSAIIEPEAAAEEHQEFIKILESNGVEVVQLIDIVAETMDSVERQVCEVFIEEFLREATPVLSPYTFEKTFEFLRTIKDHKTLVATMMGGILCSDIEGCNSKLEMLVDPMPNLYFQRDTFSSMGNGITINSMKYKTRKRETLFTEFIFNNHPLYKQVPRYFERFHDTTIEGGDIFIYAPDTLVIGISERTAMRSIQIVAENLFKNGESKFKRIFAIRVPHMSNLMHLDTWLTQIDHNKFLYSPNIISDLKAWEISLESLDSIFHPQVIRGGIEKILETIIGEKPILIPIAGENARQIDVDIETHFDAANLLVISPNVVVGYARNKKTIKAVEDSGIKVFKLHGNQLSLGMGSARCMTMPLQREDVD